jgi:hypothetical protein
MFVQPTTILGWRRRVDGLAVLAVPTTIERWAARIGDTCVLSSGTQCPKFGHYAPRPILPATARGQTALDPVRASRANALALGPIGENRVSQSSVHRAAEYHPHALARCLLDPGREIPTKSDCRDTPHRTLILLVSGTAFARTSEAR